MAIELFIPIEELGLRLEQRKGQPAVIVSVENVEENIENTKRVLALLERFKEVYLPK